MSERERLWMRYQQDCGGLQCTKLADAMRALETLVIEERRAAALRAVEGCAVKAETQYGRPIREDSRFLYKPALVQINAPLALIQVEMGARIAVANELRSRAATASNRVRWQRRWTSDEDDD